jgi:hypothetical protein
MTYMPCWMPDLLTFLCAYCSVLTAIYALPKSKKLQNCKLKVPALPALYLVVLFQGGMAFKLLNLFDLSLLGV